MRPVSNFQPDAPTLADRWHMYVVENGGTRWPDLCDRQLLLLVPHPLGVEVDDAWECAMANGEIRYVDSDRNNVSMSLEGCC